MKIESLIEKFFAMQDEVFKYFGYVQDWKVIPLDPQMGCSWMICGPEDSSSTKIAWTKPNASFTEPLIKKGEQLYTGTIYTQRFLPKWVYRGKDYTMIAVDTHCDGNQLFMIFENASECTDEKLKTLLKECW